MQGGFYAKFLKNSFRGIVGKLGGGKFGVHGVNNRREGVVDGIILTQYRCTPHIPHVTCGMLDGHPVSLHEVAEIKSEEWYAQSCRLRSRHFLSADLKVTDEDGRTFLLTTRVNDLLKSWVQHKRCFNARYPNLPIPDVQHKIFFNAKYPHLPIPDLLLILRDILCGMRDVQQQAKRDHLNINLDTVFLVSLGGRHRAKLSHMVKATSQDAKLDSQAFDELLDGIFEEEISSELQDLKKCVLSGNFTIQFLLDNHPSLMEDGLARHQARAHFVRSFLEGPYKWVETAREELEKAWIGYQKTHTTPFVFPKWKKALGGYSIKGFDHRLEDSLLDFIQVSRNLGEHKARGLTEAGVDALLCRIYPEHMVHMFHVAARAYPKYSCKKCM